MSVNILGVRIDRMWSAEIKERCAEWLSQKERQRVHQVVTVNPEFVMEAQKNPEFRTALNNSSLALADGVGLIFASVFLYGWKHRLFRMTGVECVVMLARLCVRTGRSIYLLGAGQGVAERLAEVLRRRYPRLQIAGAEEGIQKIRITNYELRITENNDTVNRDEDICKRIVDAKTDVLLVAFGAPKQDLWIARNASRLSGVRIAVGVGGAFDYLAGVVPYAPVWMRSIGLEWLYRVMTQPRRISRIVTAVIRFPHAVLKEKLRIRHSEANAEESREFLQPRDPSLRSE